jgi:hypothetical protein
MLLRVGLEIYLDRSRLRSFSDSGTLFAVFRPSSIGLTPFIQRFAAPLFS